MIDPLGLAPCQSGECADCPSGTWSLTKDTFKVFFTWGFMWKTNTTYSCLGSTLQCTVTSTCQALGGGWSVSGSVAGGFAGGGNCKCIEDLSKKDTIAFGAAGIGVTVSNGKCGGGSFGPGKGLSKFLPIPSGYVAGLLCKTESKECTK